MNEDLGIKEILEWYLTAGVDETCGEVPFALAEPAKEMPRIVPAAVSAAVRPVDRKSTRLNSSHTRPSRMPSSA